MMKLTKLAAYLVIILIIGGCASDGGDDFQQFQDLSSYPQQIPQSDIKMRVLDVSNDTGQVMAQDVIGLLWDAINNELNQRGMLWSKRSEVIPYLIEAQVVEYDAGNPWVRMVPMMGDTVLSVKAELRERDQVIANHETFHEVTFSDGPSIGAWREVFKQAAKEIVDHFVSVIKPGGDLPVQSGQ